jgi:hypothetical protein
MKLISKIIPNKPQSIDPELLVLETAFSITEDILRKDFDKNYSQLNHPLIEKLISLREEIKATYQHDQISQWTSEGFGIFIELLRKDYTVLSDFSQAILFNLVRFLGMQYGGFYVLNTENEPAVLELQSCFSFEKKRYNPKNFLIGEGIVGQAFMDGEKIYFTDIPENSLKISTTMLQIKPSCILAVPLKNDFGKYGVIELASIHHIEDYKIRFVEELCKNIATALSSTQNAIQTKKLLETTTKQAAALQQQEEELRMNLEELLSTQEEMRRKQTELERIKNELEINQVKLQEALDLTKLNEQELKVKNEELQAQEEEMRQNLEELLATQEEMRKKQTEQIALQRQLELSEVSLKAELQNSKAKELELFEKNQEIQAQQEELRQNLEELMSTQEEVKKQNLLLEANQAKLQANEAILKKAYEKSSQSEQELKKKTLELEQKDFLLLQTLAEMQAKEHELNRTLEKLKANEAILKKALDKYKNTSAEIEELKQQNEKKNVIIGSKNQEIESLREEIVRLSQKV